MVLLNITWSKIIKMNKQDFQLLKELKAIVDRYERAYNSTLSWNNILNDAAFEAKHPRDKYGKFTDKSISREFKISSQNLPKNYEALTKREIECLYLAAADCFNSEIAEEMIVSDYTVKAHLDHIYRKLKATSRLDAVVKAIGFGLIDLDVVKELREKYNLRAKLKENLL